MSVFGQNISELTDVQVLQPADQFLVVRSGVSFKIPGNAFVSKERVDSIEQDYNFKINNLRTETNARFVSLSSAIDANFFLKTDATILRSDLTSLSSSTNTRFQTVYNTLDASFLKIVDYQTKTRQLSTHYDSVISTLATKTEVSGNYIALPPLNTNVDDNLLTWDATTGKWVSGPGLDSVRNNLDHGPIGSIAAYAGSTPPEGWLECNGAAVSKTTYYELYAVIGTTFNTGSETATEFRLPDLRGQFLRGWDNGKGIDTGRTLGSTQTEETKSHAHGITDSGHNHVLTENNHTHVLTDPGHTHKYVTTDMSAVNSSLLSPHGISQVTGANTVIKQLAFEIGYESSQTSGANVWNTSNSVTNMTIGSAKTNVSIASTTTNITINSTGGAETRPTNVAAMYIIKYTKLVELVSITNFVADAGYIKSPQNVLNGQVLGYNGATWEAITPAGYLPSSGAEGSFLRRINSEWVASTIAPQTIITSSAGTVSVNNASTVEFTDIPSTAKRVTLVLSNLNVTANESNYINLQLGTTAGYLGGLYSTSSAGYDVDSVNRTAFVGHSIGSPNAGSDAVAVLAKSTIFRTTGATLNRIEITGLDCIITFVKSGTNKWVTTHNGIIQQTIMVSGGGRITLPGSFAKLQITTPSANTFLQSGDVTLHWE
jgi:microcystin-dependent protein